VGLAEYKVGAGLAVSDLDRARAFYEGRLGLVAAQVSAGHCEYRCAEDSILHLYVSPTGAGSGTATLASWRVPDLVAVVDELAADGVEFLRLDEPPVVTDERGIAHFDGGAKVAYLQDPDGNTLSLAQPPDD
jgi:catechol 2,3-dioxygenase-like lactoylglutathione lyase family enzyme